MDESGVWFGGRGGEEIGGTRLFSLRTHHNSITPNWGKNTKGKQVTHIWTKLPLAKANVQHYAFFPFCLFMNLPHALIVSFVYSFFLLPPLFFILCSPVSSYLSFGTLPPIFFFFLYMIFIFNKFRWLLFFLDCLLLFCINWVSFFNKSIWVNLYKLTFSIPQLFHSQPNKKEEN